MQACDLSIRNFTLFRPLLLAIDFYEDFIEVERIAITTVSLFESTSVSSAKLDTPEPDGFVADTNASFGEQILDITIA